MNTADTAVRARRGPGLLPILSLLFIGLLGVRTISTGSFWMHLASGRHVVQQGVARTDPFSFAAEAGPRWLNDTWLYDGVLYRIWDLGQAPLTILVHAAVIVIALGLMAGAIRKRCDPSSAALGLLLCGWLLAPQAPASPFVFGMLFLCVFFNLLARRTVGAGAGALLVAAQVLWANMHISFLLGPLIAALSIWESRRDAADAPAGSGREPGRRAFLTALLLAVTLVNPYGIRLPAIGLRRIFDPESSIMLEWISPYAGLFDLPWGGYASTLTLALIALGFVLVRERLPLLPTALAVIGAFLLVRSSRFAALAAFLAFPFVAIAMDAVMARWAGRSGVARKGLTAAVAVMVLASMMAVYTNHYYRVSGSASGFGLRVQEGVFPEGVVAMALLKAPASERTLNLPMDGGYLLWAMPDHRVFTDTRQALYGAQFYQGLQQALRGEEQAWTAISTNWNPSRILLNCCWPGAAESLRWLLTMGPWRLVYFDGTSALLVTPEGRAGIPPAAGRQGLAMLEVSRRAYEERLKTRPAPPNPSRLIGAANVFQILGKFREAEALFVLLVQGAPALSSAWLGLCNSQIAQMKLDAAVETLALAEPKLSKRARVWLWMSLSRAYEQDGQKDRAADAVRMARNIDSAFAASLADTNAAVSQPDRR
jgi:tetratricopeptide (TPR) repeat protein